MNYHIGETVVHWSLGPGTITAIDEMDLAGTKQTYYVITIDTLKIWVPVNNGEDQSIRPPTDSDQFKALFNILSEPGEQLSDNSYQRKGELRERLKDKSIIGICHVIRDLTDRKRSHALNPNDSSVLSHAESFLLDEWVLALGTNRSGALRELGILLKGNSEEVVQD